MKAGKIGKRKLRAYKIKDSIYQLAMKRAIKDKNPLSTQIETWVSSYAAGYNIISDVPRR